MSENDHNSCLNSVIEFLILKPASQPIWKISPLELKDQEVVFAKINVPENWIEVSVLVELRTVRIMTQGNSNLRPLWRDQQP